jgi:anti-anti-sigma factor
VQRRRDRSTVCVGSSVAHHDAPDLGNVRTSHCSGECTVAIAELPTTDRSAFRIGHEGNDSVLWLVGDHDVATVGPLRLVLVDLIALDDCDIVVDLGEATFVGSVMIGELLRAREHLVERGRWLTVRAPSRFVQRMFEICDVRDLFNLRSA